MDSLIVKDIDKALLKKYDERCSFYTDYPYIGLWTEEFKDPEYRIALQDFFKENANEPIILYIHFPYCPKQCLFCHCYTVISSDKNKINHFMQVLYKEMDLMKKFFQEHAITPNFKEIHLGGGSPDGIDAEEFERLLQKFRELPVELDHLDEFTIEIDIRNNIDKKRLEFYHEKGINRISFGVQDFDPVVQKAVNRVQPAEMFEELLTPDIRKKFKSVNFDIIWGLPHQTRESWRKTIEQVIKLSPDRIAMCVFGYRPDIFRHQKALKEEAIPDLYERTRFNLDAMQALVNHGYVRIGIDHFALPTDEVAIAMQSHKMHRNSLGYTPGRCKTMLSVGPSGVIRVGDHYYFQNVYSVEEWEKLISMNKFPIGRGYKLNQDLIIRRTVMHRIMEYFEVDFAEIEEIYSINFQDYFREELEMLKGLMKDGLVERSNGTLKVTPLGRNFLRNICKVFDILDRMGKHYKHSMDWSDKKMQGTCS